jgi:MFS family permease
MILVVWWKLPESIAFLQTRRGPDALIRINALMAKLSLPSINNLDTQQSIRRQVGFAVLASRAMLVRLIPLSVSFLCVMTCFYFVSAWTPKLLTDAGFAASSGISGGIILNVCGAIGGILLAWTVPGPRIRLLTIGYIVASAVGMAVYGVMSNLTPLLIMAGVLGFFLVGAMIGLYSLTPALFPASARATATGFAIGMGRCGAMAGPVVTGILIEQGQSTQSIYLAFTLPLLVAAVALFVIHRLVGKEISA